MKFQNLALAATLVFGAATAIAATNDAKESGESKEAVPMAMHHHTAHRHHAHHHQAMGTRHHGNAHAMREHQAEHMAGYGRHEGQPAMNSAGREDRMEQALQKFRTTRG
jgi:hypothetical protein